ncbi:protein ABHD12B [Tribolium castaneum]|uniref:protein ABHD12B n=1 Tax=Tribolium castaneum TaxID=7070 RepID=UPI00077DE521|nr:PREDICTED: protein ABHD12B [Tribolium castaneum]|eukprot:XP_015834045.1 PREDICTED: protein ABHD12B [Tribolium castaneum]
MNRAKEVIYVRRPLSRAAKRRLKYVGIFLLVFALLLVLFVFIGFPLIFMNSIALQRLLMFTNWNLPSKSSHFEKFELLAGLRNFYVSVNDLNSKKIISLGVWHLLPYIYEPDVITDSEFDFESVLKSGNSSVLFYFHGTGEDRSSAFEKYKQFRGFFHVITFDYRSYADSTKAELSEDAVVNDCVQLYERLLTRTNASIIFWGHSLGSALATRTLAIIQAKHVRQPIGLVLEAAFTKMSEELYVHPYDFRLVAVF